MQRERYLDIAKGLAILCIVLLHYENGLFPTEINTFIGSFMISMFYITSGWVMAMRSNVLTTKELVRKRWQQLGKPYCYWTIIIICFDMLLWSIGYYDSHYILREIYKSVTLRGIGTLWFLPALFFGELIWHWLYKKKTIIKVVMLLAVLGYINIYHFIFDSCQDTVGRIVDAPFRVVANASSACIAIAVGYYSYHIIGKKFKEWSSGKLFICGISLCLTAYITANYLPTCISFLWGCLAPLIGPVAFLCLARTVQDWRVMNIFDYWGKNSLLLMVTHYSIILVLFQWLTENVLHESFSGWISLGCFFLSMPIQYLLVPLFNKYGKILLGK